jgi:hypothetical protein
MVMAKKVFVLFLVCCFLSSTTLSGAAFGAQRNIAAAGALPACGPGVSGKLSPEDAEELAALVSAVLEQLRSLDTSGDPYVATLVHNLLALSGEAPGERGLEEIVGTYLGEVAALEPNQLLTPGCISNVVTTWFWLGAVNPILNILLIYGIFNSDTPCTLAVGFWTLTSIGMGLNNWVGYRICAEESLEDPDEEIIASWRRDQVFLLTLATISFTLGIAFAVSCNNN